MRVPAAVHIGGHRPSKSRSQFAETSGNARRALPNAAGGSFRVPLKSWGDSAMESVAGQQRYVRIRVIRRLA